MLNSKILYFLVYKFIFTFMATFSAVSSFNFNEPMKTSPNAPFPIELDNFTHFSSILFKPFK